MNRSFGMAILLSAMLTACQNSSVTGPDIPTTTPTAQKTELVSTNYGQKVTTGGVSFDQVDAEVCDPGLCITSLLESLNVNSEERLSFVAHGEGTSSDPLLARGRFSLKVFTGVVVKGDVVCFQVAGNDARVGGVVTQSNDPIITPGTSVIWIVEDNGEGNDPPDRYSGSFFTAEDFGTSARGHCTTGSINTDLSAVGTGNVKIHKSIA